MFSAETIHSTYSLYKAALDYNSHLRNNFKILCHSSPIQQTANTTTITHSSFFPCIWVIPCLLPSIRTVDLAVQKLLNTEKFWQVPLVYSYFSTGKYRGRPSDFWQRTLNMWLPTHKQQHATVQAYRAEASVPSTALRVSLGFNLAVSG